MEEIEPPHAQLPALPETTEVYKAVLASSRDAIVGLDRQGTIIFWNKGAEHLFGYSSKEILGQPVTNLLPPKARQRQSQILTACLCENSGRASIIDTEALRKDGSTFRLELSLSVWQQNAKLVGLAIARDATERKQLEQTLLDSTARYGELFAHALEALLSLNSADNLTVGTRTLEKLRGYCVKELIEMKQKKSLPPQTSEHISQWVDRILNGDELMLNMVQEILRKDGKKLLTQQYIAFTKSKTAMIAASALDNDIPDQNRMAEQWKSSLIDLVKIISRVVESCDPYTAAHQHRVAELACLVGRHMGLGEDIIERLHFNGLLHDIGKICVPTSVLAKPGKLVEEEWALIHAHTRQGYRILKDVNFPWPVADVALQHHERLDGSGYPDGLTGDKLSLEVSILAVCDVVEAMSSHRPYRPARTTTDILQELTDGRGTKYNISVVDAIVPLIASGEFASMWNNKNSITMPR